MKNNPLRKILNVTRNLVHNISGNLTGGALLANVFYGNWICGDVCPNNVGRCAMFSDVGETFFITIILFML